MNSENQAKFNLMNIRMCSTCSTCQDMLHASYHVSAGILINTVYFSPCAFCRWQVICRTYAKSTCPNLNMWDSHMFNRIKPAPSPFPEYVSTTYHVRPSCLCVCLCLSRHLLNVPCTPPSRSIFLPIRVNRSLQAGIGSLSDVGRAASCRD